MRRSQLRIPDALRHLPLGMVVDFHRGLAHRCALRVDDALEIRVTVGGPATPE